MYCLCVCYNVCVILCTIFVNKKCINKKKIFWNLANLATFTDRDNSHAVF